MVGEICEGIARPLCQCSSKGKIDPATPGEGMIPLRQRIDAVKVESRWTSPHDNITMLE